MVKFFLEEEVEELTDGKTEKKIQKVKEVKDEAEAIKDKTEKKCFLHTCYHDEARGRPCTRRAI